MAIVAQLVPTPVPANTQNGSVPGTDIKHVTITPAGGAGTYTFPHNLPWTPTYCWGAPELAEGVTPANANAAFAWCFADTSSTLLAVNLPATNVTWDIYYG